MPSHANKNYLSIVCETRTKFGPHRPDRLCHVHDTLTVYEYCLFINIRKNYIQIYFYAKQCDIIL